jgi:type IV pilus assembly protein PilM
VATATVVGLDIGSTQIRAVEAISTKDGTAIGRFGQVEVARGAMDGGVIADEKAITAAIRHLWSSQRFKSRDVVLGIANPQVVVREVDIPQLPAKHLKQALPYQVRDVIPLPVDDALLDFHPLEEPGKGHTVHGLLVAAPKAAVLNTVRVVERAGLSVRRADLAPFAMLRAAAHPHPGVEGVIDIGAEITTIVIHDGGLPQIVRTVPRGGAEITATVASRLNLPLAQAEDVKRQVGLSQTTNPELTDVITEALRPLFGDILSSVNYYSGMRPGAGIDRLALVGGGSLLPGLVDALGRRTGIPAYLADPLQHVRQARRGRHEALKRHRASAAVSIGLTIGAG